MANWDYGKKLLFVWLCLALLAFAALVPLTFGTDQAEASCGQLQNAGSGKSGLFFNGEALEGSVTDEAVCGSDAPAVNEARAEKKTLVVIMYHKILANRKGKYIVTAAQFENDLKELKARGYETVFPSELVKYCEGKGNLPEKPLLITFDDGCYNNHHYGTPILKKYGCKAVINIVGSFSANTVASGDHSNAAYSHLTWDQIKEMAKEGVFEIGNHTYDMHKFKPRYGIKPKKGETDAQYKDALTADVMRLQEIFASECGIKPICFAYPFGSYTKKSREILKELGFKIMLNCYEKPAVITKGKPQSLHDVNRYNRSGSVTTAAFFDKIEKDVSSLKKAAQKTE